MTTTTTTTIAVKGMRCSSCGILIDEALEELAGVTWASTDLKGAMTTVQYDPATTALDAVVTEITGLGYKAEPV